MLQRIQTIYLVLAFICTVLMLFFPIFNTSVIIDTRIESQSIYMSNWITTTILIGLSLLIFASILLYKSISKQLLVARISFFIYVVTAGVLIFYKYKFEKSYQLNFAQNSGDPNEFKFGLGIGYFFIFAALPFILLAIRAIISDIKLVKSLDRLR